MSSCAVVLRRVFVFVCACLHVLSQGLSYDVDSFKSVRRICNVTLMFRLVSACGCVLSCCVVALCFCCCVCVCLHVLSQELSRGMHYFQSVRRICNVMLIVIRSPHVMVCCRVASCLCVCVCACMYCRKTCRMTVDSFQSVRRISNVTIIVNWCMCALYLCMCVYMCVYMYCRNTCHVA